METIFLLLDQVGPVWLCCHLVANIVKAAQSVELPWLVSSTRVVVSGGTSSATHFQRS